MVMSRYPNLLTERLQRVIVRNSIIASHFAIGIAALLDVLWEPYFDTRGKILVLCCVAAYMIIGVFRLRPQSILNRKPIIAIALYSIITFYAITYLTDIRGFWFFIWLVPLFLASFYYGRKGALIIIGLASLSLFLSFATYIEHITNNEDYLYGIGQYLFFLALCLFFIDTLSISEEDRKMLISSLEKAEFEEERINSLVNSMEEAVIGIDQQGSITFHNTSALNLLGVDSGERLNRKRLESFVRFVDANEATVPLDSLLAKGKERYQTSDLWLMYGNEEKIHIYLAVAGVHTESHADHENSVLIIRDITQEKSLEEQRRVFVSVMSHELRTPLTTAEADLSTIKLLLNEQDASPKTVAAADQAHNQIMNLSRIINNFSMFLEVGDQPDNGRDQTRLNLYQLLEELKQKFEPAAQSKGLDFRIDAGDHDERLLSYPTRALYIGEILRHLIENAIEHTDEGGIQISLTSSDRTLQLYVKDTGKGIARADQQRIFKPFNQAQDYETRDTGGSGLGLFISRQLSQTLGGSLEVESEAGAGSTFILTLPLDASQPQTEQAPPQTEPAGRQLAAENAA